MVSKAELMYPYSEITAKNHIDHVKTVILLNLVIRLLFIILHLAVKLKCAFTAQKTNLGYIKSSVASRLRGDSAPLVCPCKGPPGALHPLWGPQHTRDVDLLEWEQRRAAKVISVLEPLSYEDRPRVGVVQPGEAKVLGRPFCGLSVPEGGFQESW